MSTDNARVTFRATLDGHEITGPAVNPGEWFGKLHIIGVGCGFSMFFYAVEAGHDSDAIDALTDSEDHGHIIRLDESDIDPDDDDDDVYRAGNAGEPVDLDNVRIWGPEQIKGLVYVTEDGRELTPAKFADPIMDFGDYADFVTYCNQQESGFDDLEGDWYYGDESTLTVYTGTFGNDHSPGASHYTDHETYATKAQYLERMASLEALPEYLESDDDDEEDVIDDDDVTTEDGVRFYQSGKLWLTVDPDWTEEETSDAIRTQMEAEGFFPNVWMISDHGNVSPFTY